MTYNFLDHTEIDDKLFYRCITVIINQTPIQLNLINEICISKYNKNIIEFISYLIKIGEILEEYEICNKLKAQKVLYNKWIADNLEILESITLLLTKQSIEENKQTKKYDN